MVTAASGVAALHVKVASRSTGQRETPYWGSCTVTAGVVVAKVAVAAAAAVVVSVMAADAVQGSMIALGNKAETDC